MTSEPKPGTTSIQVLDRAATLLDVLADVDGPRKLREIAREAGLSPSTTRRILSSLCAHGLCEQREDGTYHLGLRLFELGSRVEAGLDLRSRANPSLRRLSEQSHLTAFICVRSHDRAIALDRVDGRYAFSLALTVGGSLPLHVGAGPVALIAFSPEDEMRELFESLRPLKRYTDRTITDVDRLIEYFRQIKEAGYVLSDEDVTPGVAALGMPIFSHASEFPIASVSVAGLVTQVAEGRQREDLVAQLREAAEEISRSLGHGIPRTELNNNQSQTGGTAA